jgi:hypothetical protein
MELRIVDFTQVPIPQLLGEDRGGHFFTMDEKDLLDRVPDILRVLREQILPGMTG